MKEAALIRDLAERNWSRNQVAIHLGLSFAKFKALLEIMPPMEWCKPHHSLLCREYHASIKGRKSKISPEAHAQIIEASKAHKRKYRICGVQCTVREMYDLYAEFIGVSYHTVARRILRGQGDPGFCLYDALFTPAIPPEKRQRPRKKHAK